jgi:hypothetical protein
MKRLLFVLIAFASTHSFAQQGAWYIGGDVQLQHIKTTNGDGGGKQENSNFTWGIAPEAGTYLSNHLQVGAGLSVGGSKSTYTQSGSSSTSRSTTFGGMALARYFFTTTALRPFAGLKVEASGGNSKTDGSTTKVRNFSAGGSLTAGFAYSFTPRFSALASIAALSFTHQESKLDGSGDMKATSDNLNFFGSTNASTFNLGVQYLIPKRKRVQEEPTSMEDR